MTTRGAVAGDCMVGEKKNIGEKPLQGIGTTRRKDPEDTHGRPQSAEDVRGGGGRGRTLSSPAWEGEGGGVTTSHYRKNWVPHTGFGRGVVVGDQGNEEISSGRIRGGVRNGAKAGRNRR